MKTAEYRKIHGVGSTKTMNVSQKSKQSKQSTLSLNVRDDYLNSENICEFTPPLYINHEGADFYIYRAIRKGITFQIFYGTTADLVEKKVVKSSQIHASFLKIVKKFGLSLNAKKLYKGLGSYDLHVSGQANLTTLRWSHKHSPDTQITVSHENHKDLIFCGSKLAEVVIRGQTYRLFNIEEKCPFKFLVAEVMDDSNDTFESYNLSSEINEAISVYGTIVKAEFLKLI